MNIASELIEYSKKQFYTDVEKWIEEQVKFFLNENYGKESSWSIVLDSYNCHINEDHLSIWKPCFSFNLYDDDYEVYIDNDFDSKIFKYPVYYIFMKDTNGKTDLNGNNITIEIL